MFHLFYEDNTEDTYAAIDLAHAKRLMVELVGEQEAKEYDDWSEVPDDKQITVVDPDGPYESVVENGIRRTRFLSRQTKAALEWANQSTEPGVRFSKNW